MVENICKVLLIDDDRTQCTLIGAMLQGTHEDFFGETSGFELVTAQSLGAGLDYLSTYPVDVVLLNLFLPDSYGLETLIQLIEHNANVPIVVQTGENNETLVVKAFQLGAHGYLPKRSLDKNLLIYALRLAIERKVHSLTQQTNQQQAQQLRELQWLETLANSGNGTQVTSRLFGSEPIKTSVPDIFQELVALYSQFLELALEKQTYKVEHNISDKLRTLAEKLGLLKAGPRDVVEIHSQALKHKTQDVTLAKAQAYVTEGRFMVLELMGHLTTYYRKYYIGLSNINIFPNSQQTQQK